jgi:predicted small integral membrane protein
MNLIYLAATLALVLVNLAGLTLLVSRWLPPFALARSAGILLLCLVLFCVEHFIGFGNLSWVWPLTTLSALCLLWRGRAGLAKASGSPRSFL